MPVVINRVKRSTISEFFNSETLQLPIYFSATSAGTFFNEGIAPLPIIFNSSNSIPFFSDDTEKLLPLGVTSAHVGNFFGVYEQASTISPTFDSPQDTRLFFGNSISSLNVQFDKITQEATGLGTYPTTGLICYLDASSPTCDPGTGTALTDLAAGGGGATIVGTGISRGGTGFAKYWQWDTKGTLTNTIRTNSSLAARDFVIVFMPNQTIVNDFTLVSLFRMGTNVAAFRMIGANGIGPWRFNTNSFNSADWTSSASTYYYNGQPIQNTGNQNVMATWNSIGGAKVNALASFQVNLGSEEFANRGFMGRIAMALFYNRVLSAAEHLQIFNQLKARFNLP